MANARGTKSGIMTFEEFVPPSGWTQDSASHHLLVDLPGFRKEQVRLQVNNRGEIITSGERQASEKEYKRFTETFKIPENSDIGKIRGKFDGEVLYVTIPKLLPKEEDDGAGKRAGEEKIDHGGFKNLDREQHDGIIHINKSNGCCHINIVQDWIILEERGGGGLLGRVVKNVRENKGIVITTVLAFSLGVLVSHKLRINSS